MPTGHDITRTILFNVPPWLVVVFYVAAFTACGVATLGFLVRLSQYRGARSGRPKARSLGAAVWSVVAYLTFHEQLRRDRYAGTAHLLMFHGFVVLFIGTCLVFLEHDTPLHFFHGWFYLIASLVVDLGGVAFIVGLCMFAARRARKAPQRILLRWWVGSLTGLLLLIGLSGFLLEGARIAVDMPCFEKWSVVGYATAGVLRLVGIEGPNAAALHRVLWAGHAAFCVAFFVLLPWRFFGHMFYGAVSWAMRATRPLAQLRVPANGSESGVQSAQAGGAGVPGAVTWRDLGWSDLMQADACTTCGRCNQVCPAQAAGKPLQPRESVLALRDAMNDRDRPETSFIEDDVLWSCTTCGACNHACPVGIDVYGKLVELRRGRVESGQVPAIVERVFESSAEHSNPFDKPPEDRMHWAAGLDVRIASENEPIDLLYWVGCAGAFDADGRGVAQAMISILNHLKVDYRVLGPRECCTGDPARRMGEEGLFREQAQRALGLFRRHQVRRILTHCPHCFNTFLNEYPALGGRFKVEHHSQFLARMVQAGRLKSPTGIDQTVTFHDPCYLGRGNGQTEAPRAVLASLPQLKLVEMERHGRDSFCCGAGGGAMWLDVPGQTRVENLRAQEAARTGASTVATACPFCKSMLASAGQAQNGAALAVKDLAELIVESEGL